MIQSIEIKTKNCRPLYNILSLEINMSGVIHAGLSDHSIIYGIGKINPVLNTRMKEIKIEIRHMKTFNRKRFNEDLLRHIWENILFGTLEIELFLEILDKHAPIHHGSILRLKYLSMIETKKQN